MPLSVLHIFDTKKGKACQLAGIAVSTTSSLIMVYQ
jgi:hypothetical protein